MATTTAAGPLDELIALHDELGVFAAVDSFELKRERSGVPDHLLLRTVATLPFLSEASLSGATETLFKEPAILLQLGWAPAHIRSGSNHRHRHPEGRQVESLPCHPDTLRDALRRIAESAWDTAQRTGVTTLYKRQLVRGSVYAIDGTGLGNQYRVVAIVCVSSERPIIVAWRVLEGPASEKGKEALVTRGLVEEVLARGGAGCMRLLLADALYADGPLLVWLKYQHGIDALVALPPDRDLYQDIEQLAAARLIPWNRHQYVRTISGHKQVRVVDVASVGELTSWQSFMEAARAAGHPEASLWGCVIRQVAPPSAKKEDFALVSTRSWHDGWAALHAYRPRWHIEDDSFRELKEGWGLEKQRWGRDVAAVRARVALTCLAFNTAQVYRSRAGQRLAKMAIRRLRRQYHPELGRAPVVVYLSGCYGVLAVEELLSALGAPVGESLLPAVGTGAAHGPSP
jgi:hypothetical protein